MAAEEVLLASLKTVIIADAGAAAMRAEMEKVAELTGKLFSWF